MQIVLSKDPVLRYQDGTKKNKNTMVPRFFSSTGGTEDPVLDVYGPMISATQETWTKSQNPVIKSYSLTRNFT